MEGEPITNQTAPKTAEMVFCRACGARILEAAEICPMCGVRQKNPNEKDKTVAGLLAIFFGSLGVHKFYMGKPFWGIVYILFCWTYLPGIVGFIEGLIYLFESEESFQQQLA